MAIFSHYLNYSVETKLSKTFKKTIASFILEGYLKIMPFSTENESLGKPEIFHERIFTGSPSVETKEKC